MKRIHEKINVAILLLFAFSMFSCNKDEADTLSISHSKVEFQPAGGNETITIKTNTGNWSIDNPANWLELSSTSGTENETNIILTVNTKTIEPRSTKIVISAGSATPVELEVSQLSSEYLYSLSSNKSELIYEIVGGAISIDVSSDAPSWNINCDADWLQFSEKTDLSGNKKIDITAIDNTDNPKRETTITITGQYAPTITIPITQKGELYPNYNTSPIAPDMTGMVSSAQELAAKINLGWNVGNSLEASGGETGWGNPMITKALIDLVKQSGFNAVRIPCAWNQYLENSATAEIKTDWLNRVKEVVQYCTDNDMYVLLNIHWDGGWLENNCTEAKKDENNAKQKAFWQQIATHFRDFDEHLLFASANEPNVESSTQMEVLNSYHQTFINAVRSTGGKNSYRVLVVQGPYTDIERTNDLMNSLPTDEVTGRMMVEIHSYTPWQFCGLEEDADWGNIFYYWGINNHSTTDTERNPTWGEEDEIDRLFGLMKTKFTDNGIPVVLGEYGAIRRTSLTGDALNLHNASRAYYLKYVTQKAIETGLIPFYWDNGGLNDLAFGIFNRNDNTVFDQLALDALIEGAAK